jgi:hypothetical protein
MRMIPIPMINPFCCKFNRSSCRVDLRETELRLLELLRLDVRLEPVPPRVGPFLVVVRRLLERAYALRVLPLLWVEVVFFRVIAQMFPNPL